MNSNFRPLRIGVDVSLLAEPLAGIGRYTFEMLKRLVESPHTWYLYSNRELAHGQWSRPNVKLRTATSPWGLSRMLWFQSFMSMQVTKDQLDLFWSPAHRLPALLSDRVARVVTIHDLVWKHAPETMRPLGRMLDATLMPAAVRIADKIITVSFHTAQDLLREMPYASGKVEVIPLGVAVPEAVGTADPVGRLGLDRPFVLFVGTLEPRKNLSRLLEAYSRLPTSLQQKADMVIVGGKGWGGVHVEEVARLYGISRSIHVLGYVSNEVLAELYARAIFLAMPSLYEGFGLPLLEAMARGTPVLTSDCSSMPEVVGGTGHLVNPRDVSSIAAGLAEMIGNAALREELASRSAARAANFSWDKAAQETMKVFDVAAKLRRGTL